MSGILVLLVLVLVLYSTMQKLRFATSWVLRCDYFRSRQTLSF